MKSFLLIMGLALAASSCSKDKTPDSAGAAVTTGTEKLTGMFYPTAGIAVSGNARVLSSGNTYTLILDPFLVSAGPDLKVYLSKQDTPFEFINLGALKSNNSAQSYEVPGGVDFAVHRYVLIHCQQYNHLFAIAELKP